VIPALALVLAAAAADPCAPIAPGEEAIGDPGVLLSVGLEELAAGARDTAALAFREALRRAPSDARAASGLELACGRTSPDALLAEAVRSVEAGACGRAIDLLTVARAAHREPASALLEAVCHVRAGADGRAEPLLREALADARTGAAARLLLGVLARRSSDERAARAWLLEAAASGDPRVGAAARQMLPSARRDGRIVASLYSGAAWDSNALLAPEDVPTPEGRSDWAGAATAAILVRPFGRSGPFARGALDERRHLRFQPYDSAGWTAAGGWALRRPRGGASVEYAHQRLELGDAPYLAADVVTAAADRALGPVWLGGRYAWRRDRYEPDYAGDFSDDRHAGELRVAWGGPRGWGTAGYRGARVVAGTRRLSYVEHGPAAQVGVLSRRGDRLWVEGALLARIHDALDPDLGVRLTRLALEGGAGAEVVLAGGLSAHAFAGGALVDANADGLSYRKLAVSLGLSWEVSWP
jgi:hypothetical protein